MEEDLDLLDTCPICGGTATVELADERQSITICADCGSDF